jgi:hypothetical protein
LVCERSGELLKTKAVIIIISFVICLIAVLAIRVWITPTKAIHQVKFYDNGSDWRGFQLTNASPSADSGNIIIAEDFATLISPNVKAKFPFNELLLCWNCYAGDSGGLSITIAVSADSQIWHEFAYQDWRTESKIGTSDEDSLPRKKIAGVGYVDTDIIKLDRPAKYYRFKISFFKTDSLPFYLDRISVCYSNTKANLCLYGEFDSMPVEDIPEVSLAVPFFSQGDLPDSISGKTCSPTSLTMVLNYHRHQYSALEVSAAVYDPFNDIYGNWPYNMEAAYLMGIAKTWIGRHNSFNEIADEINSGKPVIISIDVSPGKLTGAPYTTTAGAGHLIVVRGFDGDGNVLVNDPAGDNPHEGIVAYDLSALTEIWVEHGGVAYHLWP